MVLVQLGAGVDHALYTLAGGLAGVLAAAHFFPPADAAANDGDKADKAGKADKADKVDKAGAAHRFADPTGVLGAALGGLLFAGLGALELVVPWVRVPVAGPVGGGVFGGVFDFLAWPAWHPVAAGVLVGLLQAPAGLLLGGKLVCVSNSFDCSYFATKGPRGVVEFMGLRAWFSLVNWIFFTII